jgi:hypothetical protein
MKRPTRAFNLLLICTVAASVSAAVEHRASAAIIISGIVKDTSGLMVDGVVVKLSGSAQATATTDINGKYSFSVAPGSYSVSASGQCASFEPNVVNLNNLTTGATVDFTGTGGFCLDFTFSGATSGPLTISGAVTSAGHAVPGAKVTLAGSTSAFRYTDQAGKYSFSVSAGSYSVKVTGACNAYSPDVANLNGVTTSKVQNFTGSGNCPVAPLAMCPALDEATTGTSLGSECDIVSTPDCAFERAFLSWGGEIVNDFLVTFGPDCRFGTIGNGLTNQQILDYLNGLAPFTLYFFGCPATGTVTGPLTFDLLPAPLFGHQVTTADLAALSADYVAGIQQALADFGAPPLTSAQLTAINAQLAALAARVPNVVNSSSYTFSNCQ